MEGAAVTSDRPHPWANPSLVLLSYYKNEKKKNVELIFSVISGQVLQHLIYMSLVSKLILKPSYNLTRFTYTDIITPKLFLI